MNPIPAQRNSPRNAESDPHAGPETGSRCGRRSLESPPSTSCVATTLIVATRHPQQSHRVRQSKDRDCNVQSTGDSARRVIKPPRKTFLVLNVLPVVPPSPVSSPDSASRPSLLLGSMACPTRACRYTGLRPSSSFRCANTELLNARKGQWVWHASGLPRRPRTPPETGTLRSWGSCPRPLTRQRAHVAQAHGWSSTLTRNETHMRDLNYQLKTLCRSNRDGSYATQAQRQRSGSSVT